LFDWGIWIHHMELSSMASSGPGDGKGIAAGDIAAKDGENVRLGEGVKRESEGELTREKT